MLKRPVRSGVTASILLLLLEGPRTSVELAEELGLFPSQVNPYLNYYKKIGLVRKVGELWELTEKGKNIIEERYEYLKKIQFSEQGIKYNKIEENRIKYNKINSISRIKNKAKEWLGEEHNECMIIVDFLLHLYYERGKVYFEAGVSSLVDDLSQALEEYMGSSSSYISPFTISRCLTILQQKGIVYIYKGRKVRLHRTLIEKSLEVS